MSFSVSYSWGMRGTVIGGEKGAMLPGLLAGLIPALFAGGEIARYFYIPAAAGLIGMSFGGIEPYGETIGFVLNEGSSRKMKIKGYCGLALKGALWFGICGGIIGISLSCMGCRYSVRSVIILCALIPFAQFSGYNLFNRPYNKENSKRPLIYFSEDSREEWGSNAGLIILITVFALIKKDLISLTLLSCGFVSGALGWVFAITFYYYSVYPFRNGFELFKRMKSSKRADGWKNMEFSLGAVGGAGLALGFLLCKKEINSLNNQIKICGLFSPLKGTVQYVYCVFIVLFILIAAVNSYEYFCSKKGKGYNSFVFDCIERPLFNVIPLVFVFLCSVEAARLMTVFMLVFVLCVKCCFDRFESKKAMPVIFGIALVVCVCVFAGDVILGGYNAFWLIFAGGLPYWFAEIIFRLQKKQLSLREKLLKNSFPVVMGYELFQITVIYITAFICLLL